MIYYFLKKVVTKEVIKLNGEELIKIKKNNARLYPIYKMFSWDLLFYYAISFIFLVPTLIANTSGFNLAPLQE